MTQSTKKRIYTSTIVVSSNPKRIGKRRRIKHKVFNSEHFGLRMVA